VAPVHEYHQLNLAEERQTIQEVPDDEARHIYEDDYTDIPTSDEYQETELYCSTDVPHHGLAIDSQTKLYITSTESQNIDGRI